MPGCGSCWIWPGSGQASSAIGPDSACPAGRRTGAPGKEEAMTGSAQCVDTVLAVLAAVEHRHDAALTLACQPAVEFCWPPSLPYAGTAPGPDRPAAVSPAHSDPRPAT